MKTLKAIDYESAKRRDNRHAAWRTAVSLVRLLPALLALLLIACAIIISYWICKVMFSPIAPGGGGG